MKVLSLSVCLVGFLLTSSVSAWWQNDGEEDELFGLDPPDTEEETSEDYPVYVFHVDAGDEETPNTEENEVETGEERTKPNSETDGSEDVTPDVERTDFGPLPDPDSSNFDVLTEKFDKLLSDFKAQQDKIAELEEANKKLVLKIDSIEQQIKTNSIILTNVRESPRESSKTTLQKVLHVLNRVMRVRTSAGDIAVALRAESNSSAKNKPIVVRFTNFATKMRVLAASHRLSHTDITVSSDYSELVAARRAALVPYLQRARAEGRRAYVLYDRLVIDGTPHTLEQLRASEQSEQEDMVLHPGLIRQDVVIRQK